MKRFFTSSLGLSIIIMTVMTAVASDRASAFRDYSHHVQFPLGFRAVGLGGAYSAVASDSSALIYNPAGLAISPYKSRSSSLHAVMNMKARFENLLEDNDVEFTGTNYPWFVGGIKKLKGDWSDWTAAAAAYSENQMDHEQSFEMAARVPFTGSGSGQMSDFQMISTTKSSTKEMVTSLGAATMVTTDLAAGLSLAAFQNREAEYTDNINHFGPFEYAYGNATIRSVSRSYFYTISKSYNRGLDLRLGTLYRATSRLDVGIMVKVSRYLQQAGSRAERDVSTNAYDQIGTPDPTLPDLSDSFEENSSWTKYDDPYGRLPTRMRLGSAWRITDTFLWTLDILYDSPVKLGDLYDNKQLKHMINYATGMEYFVAPHFPVRMGLYTNLDASPNVSKDPESDNDQHVDFYGMSIFTAWEDGDWALTLGGILERGDGKTRAIVGDDVQLSDITFRLWSAVGGIASNL